jgi:hypothetical protein
LNNFETIGIYQDVVSQNTRNNLLLLSKILIKIFKFELFDNELEPYFSLFNVYILEIIPFLFNIIKSFCIHNQTSEKSISTFSKPYKRNNSTINTSLQTSYFENNENEAINIQCICISIQDLQILIKIVKNNKEKFSKDALLRKAFEKILWQEHFLNNKTTEKNVRKYFLFYNSAINPKNYNLLYPRKFSYTFNTLESKNEEEGHEFILGKVKYCVKRILANLNLLNERVLSPLEQAESTEKLFNGLNIIIQMEDYKDSSDSKIPLSWYSLYLISNLSNLNLEYSSNNYKKLFEEIFKEEEKELKFLNEKYKFITVKFGQTITTQESLIEKMKKESIRIRRNVLYLKLSQFVRDQSVRVILQCREEVEQFISEDPILTITKREENSTLRRSSVVEGQCDNIRDFIYVFSSFKTIIQNDIYYGDQRYKIYQTISQYMQIVQEKLRLNSMFIHCADNDIEEITDILENYIIRKTYEKVFLEKKMEKDSIFYNKTYNLQWISPNNLEINPEYVNYIIWDLAKDRLADIDNEFSPKDKIKCIEDSFNILYRSLSFTTGKEEKPGVDDIIPIFIFVLIKSRIKRIYSNINYIKSFTIPGKLLANYGFYLTQFEMAREFILNIDHRVLKVSEEEYNNHIKN